ncbi:winged helix-turn-helix domain-containing protein [Streptomyces sp. NPDC051561]|uniref:winged helix-turn-helix domain-containing protein n=1 Tax=Streptomyces sp. NPDC051561 TaxID=3365658 RepID=UPI0037B8731F
MVKSDVGDSRGGQAHRVAAALRTSLSDGTYAVGSPFPAQRELADRFEVSRDTIQRVMRELVSEGWVKTRRGSGTRVAKVQQIHSTGTELLKAVVDEAFQADEVTLDVFSLTSETLSDHVAQQVKRIKAGEISPRRIAVRVLLPHQDVDLPYPRKKGGVDPRVQERMRELDVHAQMISSTLNSLHRDLLVPEVEVEVKRVRLPPHNKYYILNGRIALQGFYEVTERPIRVGSKGGKTETVDTIDVLGLQAELFKYEKDDADSHSLGTIFVNTVQKWFDSVWTHLND